MYCRPKCSIESRRIAFSSNYINGGHFLEVSEKWIAGTEGLRRPASTSRTIGKFRCSSRSSQLSSSLLAPRSSILDLTTSRFPALTVLHIALQANVHTAFRRFCLCEFRVRPHLFFSRDRISFQSFPPRRWPKVPEMERNRDHCDH